MSQTPVRRSNMFKSFNMSQSQELGGRTKACLVFCTNLSVSKTASLLPWISFGSAAPHSDHSAEGLLWIGVQGSLPSKA